MLVTSPVSSKYCIFTSTYSITISSEIRGILASRTTVVHDLNFFLLICFQYQRSIFNQSFSCRRGRKHVSKWNVEYVWDIWICMRCLNMYEISEYVWDVWICMRIMRYLNMYEMSEYVWGCLNMYEISEYVWDVWICMRYWICMKYLNMYEMSEYVWDICNFHHFYSWWGIWIVCWISIYFM